jgi:hypothetical protein
VEEKHETKVRNERTFRKVMAHCKDMTDQKFGKWTALKRVGSDKNRNAVWACVSETGEKRDIPAKSLWGYLRSSERKEARIKDMHGQKFGRLTVKKWVGKYRSTYSIYQCQCDCGKTKDVRLCNLTSGGTRSCGCLRKGSRLIKISCATNIIEKIIKKSGKKGAGAKEVRKATDYTDKKIYLTLHRLCKAGRIKRIKYGTYIKDN